MPIQLPPGTAAYSDQPPPSNRQLLVLLGLLGLAIGLTIGAVFWLWGQLVWLVPTSVEQQLGRVIVPVYEAQAYPSAAQTSLNRLLNRLEAQLPSEQADRDYQALYIPDQTVNALAIPGDRIVIYQGLLEQVESENELMMVLGHELGHFANRDHLRGLGRRLLLRLVLSGLLGDLGSLGSVAGTGVEALSNARFSQAQEYAADRVGLALLVQTYNHAGGATDFFERLTQSTQYRWAILSTHPPSQRRVRRLRQQIERAGYGLKPTTPLPRALKIEQ